MIVLKNKNHKIVLTEEWKETISNFFSFQLRDENDEILTRLDFAEEEKEVTDGEEIGVYSPGPGRFTQIVHSENGSGYYKAFMEGLNLRGFTSYVDSRTIELASNLAHNRTLAESGDICKNEDDMYLDINAETLTYTQEIQDRFNHWYDYYYTEINKL